LNSNKDNNSKILLNEELISYGLSFEDSRELLEFLGKKLEKKGIVKDSFTKAIIKRESNYPTGLQSGNIGIALPHTDAEHVNKAAISVTILDSPVKFIGMGTEDTQIDVSIIFLLAIKDPKDQISLLQNLMDLLQREEIMEKMQKSSDKKEILKLLKNEIL